MKKRPAKTSIGAWARQRARALLLVAVLLPLGCPNGDEQGGAAVVGKLAPSFALETIDHDRFYLRDHRGKPVVLLFWDTSCQICKRQMVALESLRQAMGPERVTMATVCVDPENAATARRVVDGLGLGFPTLLDRGGGLGRSLGVKAYPTTVVIAPQGKVSFYREGYTEPLMQELRRAIEGHLSAG